MEKWLPPPLPARPLGSPKGPTEPQNLPAPSSISDPPAPSGLLCYTGTATGALAQEDCKCELADQLAASTSLTSIQDLRNDARDVFEIENQGDNRDEKAIETFIENAIRNAFNEGTDVCSKLTHLPSPATVFPTEAAYDSFLENNLSASSFHLATIGIVGRQCHSPVVGTTAEERTATATRPPKMAPWEYVPAPPRRQGPTRCLPRRSAC
jgi:hypothetical protein